MNPAFTHFLITRFNVRILDWSNKDKYGQVVCDNEWMEHRFKLFEKYCAPSVEAQIRKEFKWIVMVDQDTPEEYQDRIHATDSSIILLLIKEDWLKELQVFLDRRCNTRWLITTRLDNDDVIAPWVIQRVQDNFDKQQLTFLDFPRGYRLKNGILHRHKEAFNPFLSLVEEIKAILPKGVLFKAHGRKLGQDHHTKSISDRPSWIQVIHEKNKITDKAPGPPTEPEASWLKRYV